METIIKPKETTKQQLFNKKVNQRRKKAEIARKSRRINQIIFRRNKSKLKRKNRKI